VDLLRIGGNGIRCGDGKKEKSFAPAVVVASFSETEKQKP